MLKREYEKNYYLKLAKEIKAKGYRCFLYDVDHYVWLYVITPNNSWLYIDEADFGGFNITYEYVPSRDFGTGCSCNSNALSEITLDDIVNAELYGRNYHTRGWKNIRNTYDGRTHRETIIKKPKHYENAYEALRKSYHFDKLVEIK